MAIVVGLDVHRAQMTYDALDTATGEVTTGRRPGRPRDTAHIPAPLGGRAGST